MFEKSSKWLEEHPYKMCLLFGAAFLTLKLLDIILSKITGLGPAFKGIFPI